MAEPISFQPVDRVSTRNAAKVQSAPERHADAVLAGYDLLQLLHDKGVLNLMRGAVAASDDLVTAAAEVADRPEAIGAVRNFILLSKFFASIPPDVLNSLVETASAGAARERSQRPPGLFRLLWRMRSANSRHALAVGLDLLEGLGKGL